MRGLLLALALASFALPIAAQTPCDADPRWIVVTVVRFEWTNADGQRNVATDRYCPGRTPVRSLRRAGSHHG